MTGRVQNTQFIRTKRPNLPFFQQLIRLGSGTRTLKLLS
jgi:hypothetical protein